MNTQTTSPTTLASGIPTMDRLEQLLGTDRYREHTQANQQFLKKHGPSLEGYGKHWGQDPYQLWSRRWEYPYVASHAFDYLREVSGPSRMLDAGSGVTYLPYYLCERLPNLSVVTCDYDRSYIPMFEAINKTLGEQRVTFTPASMQQMPFESAAFDSIACVSVLEHTDNYDDILKEFHRVLKPGGQLVLTFDLSLDGKFTLSKPTATKLLEALTAQFDLLDIADWRSELDRMDSPDGLLTTDAIKQKNPELLPWRYPALKAVHDLVKGHGWTGGFRSKAVFCCDARKR